MIEDLMARWVGWMAFTVILFANIYLPLGLWWMFGASAWPAFRTKAFHYAVGANAVAALAPVSIPGIAVYYGAKWIKAERARRAKLEKERCKAEEKARKRAKKSATA